jgi:hypothetical protein
MGVGRAYVPLYSYPSQLFLQADNDAIYEASYLFVLDCELKVPVSRELSNIFKKSNFLTIYFINLKFLIMNSKKKSFVAACSLALIMLFAAGNYFVANAYHDFKVQDDNASCTGSSCSHEYDGDGDGCCNKYTTSTGNRN